MKKRLLCMALCLTMLLTLCLTGCSGGEEEEEKITMTTSTLVIALVTEDGTTEEGVKEVEDAINDITEGKFETRVKLEVYSYDEYYDAIEAKLLAAQTDVENAATAKSLYDDFKKANKKDKEHGIKDTAQLFAKFMEDHADHPEWEAILRTYIYGAEPLTPDDLTYVDERGVVQTVYPEVKENQIDIFYIGSYEKFTDYVNNNWLASLSGKTATVATYIPSKFLDAAKVDNNLYAIPGCTVLGEYTYLLINKELAKKYHGSETYASDIGVKSVGNNFVSNFLEEVAEYESETYDVLKCDSRSEMNLVRYWSLDTDTYELLDEFSVIGSIYNSDMTGSTVLSFENLLENDYFVNDFTALKSFEYNGYYADEDSDRKFAAAVVTGDSTLELEYGDEYDMIVLAGPVADEDDLYGNMFAINANSSYSVDKCMEILSFLETNTEVRNLIQYGIKDQDYVIDANGQIKKTDEANYFMDLYKTGNILVSTPAAGMPEDIWKYVVQQNDEAIVDPVNCFRVTESDNLDEELTNEIRAISAHCLEEIEKCTSSEELKTCIATLVTELKANNSIKLSIGGTPVDPTAEETTDETAETTEEVTTEEETTAADTTAAETTADGEETTGESEETTEAPETTEPLVITPKSLYEIYTAWAANK